MTTRTSWVTGLDGLTTLAHAHDSKMTLLQQLNPRLHIAASIGWAVFAVVTAAALIAANLAAAEAESRARADAEGLLVEFATQVRDALSMNLETRRSVLQATAAELVATSDHSPPAVSRTLEAVLGQFPEFNWLGAVDSHGRVIMGTDGKLQDEDVGSTPWFLEGRQRPFVSEAHVHSPKEGPPLWLMDFAVPLNPVAGPDSGVVAAAVSWSWVEGLVARMQEALSKRRQVEVILAGRDGTVLVGPIRWLGKKASVTSDLAEGKRYVVGSRTQLRLADGLGLGWTTIVRQDTDLALASVRTTRRTVFLIVFVAGLLSATAAAMVTRILTRRLSTLALDAESVRRGDHRTLNPPPGADEVSRIGATLAQLVDHLQAEKQALQELNTELDRRVAERTSRIERMADETRHAAVTRERLRIARDLHDTLAHSLMALLTQIRLVRKLRVHMNTEDLDAELGRAEDVAASGLAGARAAISQMRDNGVHDTGLGPALQDLAKRFGQRTGVAVALDVDPAPAAWADDRGETVFRIVEEALRNVERHANAGSVRVRLRSGEQMAAEAAGPPDGHRPGACVEVADDGVGFDTAVPQPGHYGLLGMREQAALIAGRLSIVSEPGKGTRIVLAFDH